MRRTLAFTSAVLSTLALAACGTSSVSTSAFSGESQKAAQAVANLQADATAGEVKKICANDLSAAVVSKLGGESGCEAAVKNQIDEVDSLEVSVQKIALSGDGSSATASVKSVYQGKSAPQTLTLVRESGKWKVSGT